jgi:hypothetical protein
MQINLKINDLDYHEHLYFFGKEALETMILSLVEKFYGDKTRKEIQDILKSNVKKVELKNYQFKKR